MFYPFNLCQPVNPLNFNSILMKLRQSYLIGGKSTSAVNCTPEFGGQVYAQDYDTAMIRIVLVSLFDRVQCGVKSIR
jgi:hypothetical protein